ncbi:MAG: transposase [Chloroflexi bacterium]|nr:transposase [Chloroflexota bacterium]
MNPEATYHQKRGRGYKGYVVNVTETCDPDNGLQLIAHVQTHPNVVDDSDLLIEARPELRRRLAVEELHTDGGYNGVQTAAVVQELGLTHVQTALRGQAPQRRVGLDAFVTDTDDQGGPVRITCPNGQTATVEPSVRTSRHPRFRAVFDTGVCGSCPLQERCPARPSRKRPERTLSFSRHEAGVAQQRRRLAGNRPNGTNLRVVIESTIGSLKQPFNYGQLPVRGRFRVGMLLVGGAVMANVRRIGRYLHPERKPQNPQAAGTGAPPVQPVWRSPGWVARRRFSGLSNSLPQRSLA